MNDLNSNANYKVTELELVNQLKLNLQEGHRLLIFNHGNKQSP